MSRRVPFSGKAKKEQLKARRKKAQCYDTQTNEHSSWNNESEDKLIQNSTVANSGTIGGPTVFRKKDRKLNTEFRKEAASEIARRKKESTLPFKNFYSTLHVDQSISSILCIEGYLDDITHQPSMFTRPQSLCDVHDITAENLEKIEQEAFERWKNIEIYEKYGSENLNNFEHNIEVWRQLWRVVERCDLAVLLADARCPVLHFHESLFKYVCQEHKKECILCLTKTDLVAEHQITAWKNYFSARYPNISVVAFTSSLKYVRSKSKANQADPQGLLSARLLLECISKSTINVEGKVVPASYFVQEALGLIDSRIVASNTNMFFRETSIGDGKSDNHQKLPEVDLANLNREYMVVGMIGDPNMGKSTLMNTLLGEKRVSMSSTPGHTKHFQTIYMTKHLVLCDCPGVVHPQVGISRAMQIVFGQYPIAQVREPFSVVRYIGENCWPPLHVAYKLLPVAKQNVEDLQYILERPLSPNDVDKLEWSPYTICYCLAIKEGFMVKGKGGWPDTSRAANMILRDVLIGRNNVIVSYYPPREFIPMGEPEDQIKSLHLYDKKLSVDEESSSIGSRKSSSNFSGEESIQGPKVNRTVFALLEDSISD